MRQREEAGGEDGRRERGTVMGGRVRERERGGGKKRDPRQRQHTFTTVSFLRRIRRVARRYHRSRLIIII